MAVGGYGWGRDGGNGAVGLDGCEMERRQVRLGSAFWMGMVDGDGESVGNRSQRAILRVAGVKMRLSLGRFLLSLTPVLIVATLYLHCRWAF